ncbi:hypothetical protein BVC80_1785g4 [Macleaya cordata]|uniref:Protein POLAR LOCALIZATION DURING ASYMMETRIC DIVISION AND REDISTRIBUTION n=1 Tax=Macleaya cordata TaxID=56857 RepID=A0A200QFI4_MACCD|nr:hypothetical protein BVC80_1785g4 [Macleaya cordata]
MNEEMRISDILTNETLNDEEKEEDFAINMTKHKNRKIGGNNPIIACSSFRSVISRWIPSLKRSKDSSNSSRRRLAASLNSEGSQMRVETNGGDSVLLDSASNKRDVCNEDDDDDGSKANKSAISILPTDSEMANSSGRYMKDDSFSLGLGAGFVFLMVACKNEFNKMIELRSQVEVLIKDVKDDIRREDVICQPSKLKDVLDFSITSSPVVENTKYNAIIRNYVSSNDLVKTDVFEERDRHLECSQTKVEYVQGIDQLEAEFEAELERLQFSLETEDSLEHSRQQEQEMIDENTDCIGSHSSSDGVVDDPVEMDNGENSGVSPYELERKLHELVEARQQERIKELECALECAKQKLHQKEIEVSLWKNAATLITQHVSESSCLSR